jgi:DNA-binding NarL/FixJ family response regulator
MLSGRSGDRPLSVLVVDDHQVFAELLSLALRAEPDLVCVGHAQTIGAGMRMVEDLRPDVVLMDVRLDDGDGIAATAELTLEHPELRVVVLTAFVDRQLLQRAAAANACALLPKNGELAGMLGSLRTARRGTFTVSPELLGTTMVPSPGTSPAAVPVLTRREQQILQMLAAGLDTRVVARELDVPVDTCRGWTTALLSRLGATSQLEAVAIAVRNGLLHVAADA